VAADLEAGAPTAALCRVEVGGEGARVAAPGRRQAQRVVDLVGVAGRDLFAQPADVVEVAAPIDRRLPGPDATAVARLHVFVRADVRRREQSEPHERKRVRRYRPDGQAERRRRFIADETCGGVAGASHRLVHLGEATFDVGSGGSREHCLGPIERSPRSGPRCTQPEARSIQVGHAPFRPFAARATPPLTLRAGTLDERQHTRDDVVDGDPGGVDLDGIRRARQG
jgi:hypothetical protein